MTKYAYQIKGALEDTAGDVAGFRVFLCTTNDSRHVDVPAEVFDREVLEYLKYRLKLSSELSINKLPIEIQNKIRFPIGRWLDYWVIDNLR